MMRVASNSVLFVPPFECAWLAGEDLKFPQPGRGCVCFEALADNDITVVFKAETGSRHYRTDSGHNYTVVLGSHRNKRLRIEVDGQSVVDVPGAVISPDRFEKYWVDVNNGVIAVGKGEPGQHRIHRWEDSKPNFTIQYVGLSSWDKHVGYRGIKVLPPINFAAEGMGRGDADCAVPRHFLNCRDLSDLQFVVDADGRTVYAHRILLGSCCSAFRGEEDSDRREFEGSSIRLPKVRYEVLMLLLQFVYTGQVQVPAERLEDVEQLAMRFGLPSLEAVCKQQRGPQAAELTEGASERGSSSKAPDRPQTPDSGAPSHGTAETRMSHENGPESSSPQESAPSGVANCAKLTTSPAPAISCRPRRSLTTLATPPADPHTLARLLDTGQMADVEIAVSGSSLTIKAHRIILSLWSRPFNRMFTNGMRESQLHRIHLGDTTISAVRAMLRFMYSGLLLLGDPVGGSPNLRVGTGLTPLGTMGACPCLRDCSPHRGEGDGGLGAGTCGKEDGGSHEFQDGASIRRLTAMGGRPLDVGPTTRDRPSLGDREESRPGLGGREVSRPSLGDTDESQLSLGNKEESRPSLEYHRSSLGAETDDLVSDGSAELSGAGLGDGEEAGGVLLPLLVLADRFEVHALRQACCDRLLEDATEDSMCAVLHVASSLPSCANLCTACEEVCARNLDVVVATPAAGFRELDMERVTGILRHPQLCVSSEERVLDAVLMWGAATEAITGWEDCFRGLQAAPSAEAVFGERTRKVEELLQLVHFPVMPADLLQRLQASPLVQRLPILSELLSEALQYQALDQASTTNVSLGQPMDIDMRERQVHLRRGHGRFSRRLSHYKQLLYVFDGDRNGVCYYAGTSYGAHPWMNPVLIKRVSVSSSSPASRYTDPKVLVSNNYQFTSFAGPCYEGGQQTAWWMFDLGEGHELMCNYYTLRMDGSANFARSWVLQASNDGVAWANLRVHRDDRTLCKPGQYASWPVGGASACLPYRIFRIRMTSPHSNHSSGWNLCICYIELYGYFR